MDMRETASGAAPTCKKFADTIENAVRADTGRHTDVDIF
jgi:hypothetical protein